MYEWFMNMKWKHRPFLQAPEQDWKQSWVCVWYIPSSIGMLLNWFSVEDKAIFLFLRLCFETLDEHMYVGLRHNPRTQCLQRSFSLNVSSIAFHLQFMKSGLV